MKLFDSHCHLDERAFDHDIDPVLNRAMEAGVTRVLTVGTDPQSSLKAVSIAESYPGVYASVGVHPHNADACDADAVKQLIDLARHPKVRAWGEIGLDFNRMYSTREMQVKWFIRQIEAAAGLNLPLIFHERDSGGHFLEILKENAPRETRGVVHCFSGTQNELEAYLDLGLYIGLTGILTIKARGRTLRAQIPHIPLERLVVETDAPYLTPVPQKNRFRRNEPAFVKSVLLMLAEVKHESPQFLSDRVWENTCRLYSLNPDQAGQSPPGCSGSLTDRPA